MTDTRLTLKNVKIAKHMSEETIAFTAAVYWDGKKIGDAKNDGHGGPNDIYMGPEIANRESLRNEIEAYSNEKIPEEFQNCKFVGATDVYLGELLAVVDEDRRFKRLCKKSTVILLHSAKDSYVQWRGIHDRAEVEKEYGDDLREIVNERFVKKTVDNGRPCLKCGGTGTGARRSVPCGACGGSGRTFSLKA